jgi:hypothetical protein
MSVSELVAGLPSAFAVPSIEKVSEYCILSKYHLKRKSHNWSADAPVLRWHFADCFTAAMSDLVRDGRQRVEDAAVLAPVPQRSGSATLPE